MVDKQINSLSACMMHLTTHLALQSYPAKGWHILLLSYTSLALFTITLILQSNQRPKKLGFKSPSQVLLQQHGVALHTLI